MAVIDDVKSYLGDSAARYTDDALQAAIDTETAAQAVRVTFPVDDDGNPLVPADLAEALLRRVQSNLARREIPLGITPVSGDGSPGSYLPGTDPEVRRLEAPWRRLVVG